MKRNKTILMSGLLICGLQASLASAYDVIPTNNFIEGARYVRVTITPDKAVQFEDCKKGEEERTCKPIGPRTSYTHDQLTSERNWERAKVVGATVADIGITVSVFVGSLSLVGLPATAVEVTEFIAALGVTAASPVVSAHYIDAANPAEQYKRSETLRDTVIENLMVKEENIDDFISRLSIVLSQI